MSLNFPVTLFSCLRANNSFAGQRWITIAFLVLSLLMLNACSSLPVLTDNQPETWQDNVTKKSQVLHWRVQGRIGIQTKDQGGSFGIFWDQAVDWYKLRLTAAFGQGAFVIEGNDKTISIKNRQGEIRRSNNPAALLEELMGVNLPISSLSKWMRGIPDALLPIGSMTWNDENQLYQLEQEGWKIEMSRYQIVDGVKLPHFFVVQNEFQPDFIVRIVIRQWILNEPQ